MNDTSAYLRLSDVTGSLKAAVRQEGVLMVHFMQF
jgi:hypothetical protein